MFASVINERYRFNMKKSLIYNYNLKICYLSITCKANVVSDLILVSILLIKIFALIEWYKFFSITK